MRLVIVSGRSGSGKSTALHVLEDLGYYCIDNLPGSLLTPLVEQMQSGLPTERRSVAVSIDARNLPTALERFPTSLSELDKTGIPHTVVYLDADDQTLITRFSATRRRHPLSDNNTSLEEAISREGTLLDPIATVSDLKIDTSNLTLHQLRDIIRTQVAEQTGAALALLFISFGFKHGVPADADLVFDVRCLPNPYWDPSLREFTGCDEPVQNFLSQQEHVTEMITDIQSYLEKWIPRFEANNRSYMTVAIGCTGGQHRSVYLAERLQQHFEPQSQNVQVRHRELHR